MKHVLNNFDLGQDESNPLLIVIDPFEPQAAKHRFQNPQKSTYCKSSINSRLCIISNSPRWSCNCNKGQFLLLPAIFQV